MSEHLIHYLLIALPLILASLILLKDRLTSRFVLLTIILLAIFTLTHALPTNLILIHHHQSTSFADHSCCIPQLSAISPPIFEFNLKLFFTLLPSLVLVALTKLVLFNINNRSPPLFA